MPGTAEASACPSCREGMTRLSMPGKNDRALSLDLCFPCQAIWFDPFESGQLTPGSILELFRLIHAHRDTMRLPISHTLHCPRCDDRLQPCFDLSRSGRFTYHRCPHQHGRFTAFGQFMIEKGFVRQLAPDEIRTLAARIESVHCSGCGAPIDIRTEAACPHCGAPVSILDPQAVERALAGYRDLEAQRLAPSPDAVGNAVLALSRRLPPTPATATVGDLILSGIGLALELLDH